MSYISTLVLPETSVTDPANLCLQGSTLESNIPKSSDKTQDQLEMEYHLVEICADLIKYWSQFGFLNLRTEPSKMARSFKKSIGIRSKDVNDVNVTSDNDDPDW